MLLTSEHFIIDGIKSSDIGVDGCIIIRTDSQFSRQIIGNKSIIKDSVRYNNTPYFYTVEKDVMSFDLKFSLLDREFDEDIIFELGRIFAKDKYVSFQSCDFPSAEFWVICTSMELVTFGQYKGWIEVTLENFAPFAVSPLQINTYDFSDLTTPQTFELNAKFNVTHPKYNDFIYFPKIEIYLKGSSTGFTLTNFSDGGRTFGFSGLQIGESLIIDNELKQIESSTGLYRLDKMINNHNFFRLLAGKNILSIDKACVLQIICQYPIYI